MNPRNNDIYARKIVVIKHPKFSLLDQLKMLFVPAKMMCMTLLTWTIWFGCSLTYYGIVLLNTELLLLEAEGEHCREIYYHEPAGSGNFTNATNVTISPNSECQQLEAHHFADAFSDSLAELPGVFVTFFLLEFAGRKLTMASEMFALGLMFFILCFCMYRGPQTFVLFVGRAIIAGAFQSAYVFTAEVEWHAFVVSRMAFVSLCIAASRDTSHDW